MKLFNCFKYKVKNLWEPNFRGIFSFYQEVVHFHFLCNDSVYALNCSDGIIHKMDTGSAPKIELPLWWICSLFCGKPFLMCSKDVCVDLTNKELVDTIPTCLEKEFLHQYRNYQLFPEKKIDIQPYEFGDYAIFSKGPWSYLCKRNGKDIWSFKGRASLATDIYCWNDSLYWGTSGAGGYFYIVDLKSGEPKLSLQTGGTISFCQNGDLCYIGRRQRNKSCVVCISLSNASIIDEFALEGLFTDNSKMYMKDNKLYVVTFSQKNQHDRELIVTTIDCSKTADGQNQ